MVAASRWRDQVARLMAVAGIRGDERRRGVTTTTDAVVPTSPLTLSAGSFTLKRYDLKLWIAHSPLDAAYRPR